MKTFHYILKNDYDQKARLRGQNVLCYSKKRLSTACPEEDPRQLLEARVYSDREKKPSDKDGKCKYDELLVGEITLGEQTLGITPAGTNNRLLYKKAGYVCSSEGDHLALCTSRVPFLLVMLALFLAVVLAAVLLFTFLGRERPTIEPDHPLPPVDQAIVPEQGGDEQVQSPEGGGSVSMIYTLQASVAPDTGKAEIYFRNPKASNHSVALEFYIISDGVEYLVATSGLVPSGNGLYELTLADGAPSLVAGGIYDGLYRVYYYDPVTGVRAHVQSDITGVTVSVKH